MDFNSIGSSSPQGVSNRLAPKQPPAVARPGQPDNFNGILGDLMPLSSSAPPARQVDGAAAAPPAVSQAMSDLLSTQKDVKGDLGKLKGYFAQSPQSLTSVIGALKGDTGIYGPSGSVGAAKGQDQLDDVQAQAMLRYLEKASQDDPGGSFSTFSIFG